MDAEVHGFLFSKFPAHPCPLNERVLNQIRLRLPARRSHQSLKTTIKVNGRTSDVQGVLTPILGALSHLANTGQMPMMLRGESQGSLPGLTILPQAGAHSGGKQRLADKSAMPHGPHSVRPLMALQDAQAAHGVEERWPGPDPRCRQTGSPPVSPKIDTARVPKWPPTEWAPTKTKRGKKDVEEVAEEVHTKLMKQKRAQGKATYRLNPPIVKTHAYDYSRWFERSSSMCCNSIYPYRCAAVPEIVQALLASEDCASSSIELKCISMHNGVSTPFTGATAS